MNMTNLQLDTIELAEKYDEVSKMQFNHGKILIGDLGIKRGEHVLDIGCGTGRLGVYVAGITGSSGKVIGIDPLPYRIDIARRKVKPDIKLSFEVGKSDDLGVFKDNSFDAVYLNSVFHWIHDKTTTLSEIYRVLKPGGRLGITTASKENPNTIRLITNRIFQRKPYVGHVDPEEDASFKYGVTAPELKELLTKSSFTIKSIEIKKFTDYFDTVDTVIERNNASSFGNFLAHVPERLRVSAIEDVKAELEKQRTAHGIESVRNLIFAIAYKNRG
jgi:ubiquinone/menaquinone biosynthesis C-methylase UbiE